MAKIQTFELDRWSEPDENHRVKHIGMAGAKETFDKLKTHLEAHGLLPDEYFASRISAPARESTWIFPWPVETAMANGIFNHSPQARRWVKRRTIISECSASLPSVP